MAAPRVFLLSPARTDGERAKLLFNPVAAFDLARRLHTPQGAPLGETFAFLSGLYFRGKMAYVDAFGAPAGDVPASLVITSDRGLVSPQTLVNVDDLRAMAATPIDPAEPRYIEPLRRDIALLAEALRRSPSHEAVLLGSIATGKYVDPLLEAFGDRLKFPAEFVGRGDMSRGGLMLRAARSRAELEYVPLAGATRKGKRPAKLAPLRRKPAPRDGVREAL